jgi:periplasmic mercuric ion binding protein
MKNFIIITLALIALNSEAQTSKKETTSFWVAGACGMCEKTIENAVDVKGVFALDYDLSAHRLTITYKPQVISLKQIHDLIHAAGYDTEAGVATDEQYNRVHGCCKYRTLPVHK